MPRKEPLSLSEIAICKRLETFRKDLRIPRTVFARTVGFVSERLATYENARSPLRYDAFAAIHEHFLVNPHWLVTGNGSRTLPSTFDSGRFRGKMHGRELLSEVYERLFKPHFEEPQHVLREIFFGPAGVVERLDEIKRVIADPKAREELSLNNVLLTIAARLDFFAFSFSDALEKDGTFERMNTLPTYGNAGIQAAKELHRRRRS